MTIKKGFLVSLSCLLFGLLILVAADYSIRLYTDTLHYLGLPESLWFLFQIIIGAASYFIFIKFTIPTSITKKILLSILLFLIGFIIYTIIIYGYLSFTHLNTL